MKTALPELGCATDHLGGDCDLGNAKRRCHPSRADCSENLFLDGQFFRSGFTKRS
jgi:hypothetical protein